VSYDAAWDQSATYNGLLAFRDIVKARLNLIWTTRISSAGYRRQLVETAPGEQRRVVHREFRIIRRISRERLQNLPHNFPIDEAARIFPRNPV
jgi:hypothetical protein